MRPVTEDVLRAVMRLKQDKDFVIFFEWLNDGYIHAFRRFTPAPANVDKVIPHFVSQGAFQELFEIVDTINNAEKTLKEKKQAQEGGKK